MKILGVMLLLPIFLTACSENITSSSNIPSKTPSFEIVFAECEAGAGFIKTLPPGSSVYLHLDSDRTLSGEDIADAKVCVNTLGHPRVSFYLHLDSDRTLSGKDIADAKVCNTLGRPGVLVFFSDTGKAKAAALSQDHIGEPIGIIVDGSVFAFYELKRPLTNSCFVSSVEPPMTEDEAQKLANTIREASGLGSMH